MVDATCREKTASYVRSKNDGKSDCEFYNVRVHVCLFFFLFCSLAGSPLSRSNGISSKINLVPKSWAGVLLFFYGGVGWLSFRVSWLPFFWLRVAFFLVMYISWYIWPTYRDMTPKERQVFCPVAFTNWYNISRSSSLSSRCYATLYFFLHFFFLIHLPPCSPIPSFNFFFFWRVIYARMVKIKAGAHIF